MAWRARISVARIAKCMNCPERHLRDFILGHERVAQASNGVELLPQILVVGLISAYDAFLASLLRVVINRRPAIVLTSQKQLTFEELLHFPSIEAAKSALIDREIETVIRKSHHEHFDWMQRQLSVNLKQGLPIWPRFVELCERRNLFTHTGGVVSSQYLENCANHKADVSGVRLGARLSANGQYYRCAVEIVQEIGLKLCYVLWRKFDSENIDKADG